MEKLFALYRSLNHQKESGNDYKRAFEVLDQFVDLLQNLNEWGQEVMGSDGWILDHEAKAVHQQLLHGSTDILCSNIGVLGAIKHLVYERLDLQSYDELISHLQQRKNEIVKQQEECDLGDLDDHPFGGREPEERNPYSGNDLDGQF